MATHGALKARRIAHNAAGVVGIELLAAAQGVDFHAPLKTSPALQTGGGRDPRSRAASTTPTAIWPTISPGRRPRSWRIGRGALSGHRLAFPIASSVVRG